MAFLDTIDAPLKPAQAEKLEDQLRRPVELVAHHAWDGTAGFDGRARDSNQAEATLVSHCQRVKRMYAVRQSDLANAVDVDVAGPLYVTASGITAEVEPHSEFHFTKASAVRAAIRLAKKWKSELYLASTQPNARIADPVPFIDFFATSKNIYPVGEWKPAQLALFAEEHVEDGVLSEILRLRDGWDGDGSVAPSAAAKDAVVEVSGQLNRYISRAEIEVDGSSGEIALSWYFDDHSSIVSVNVLTDGRVVVVAAAVDGASKRTVLGPTELGRLGRVAVDAGLNRIDE